MVDEVFDSNTGQKLYIPKISNRSKYLKSSMPIHEKLYEEAEIN